MPHAEIPEIRNIPGTVDRFITEPVEAYRVYEDPTFGEVQSSVTQDSNQMIDEIFETLGIPRNRDLEALCSVISRVAVKRLVSQHKLSIEFGEFGEPPREIIEVELRPKETQVPQTKIGRTSS